MVGACSAWLLAEVVMSSYKAAPNKENYTKILDDKGEPMEDFEGHVRPIWRLRNTKQCPFPNCTENSWEKAKKLLWSLQSDEALASYVKQHGMNSTLHHKHPLEPLDEIAIDEVVATLDIDELEDDFETRKAYKASVEENKEKKPNKRKWGDDAWGGSAWNDSAMNWPAAPSNPDIVVLQNQMQALTTNVQALTDAASSAGQHGSPTITFPNAKALAVPTWAQQHADMAAAAVSQWDPSMLASVQERTITLPYSQLLLYKESVGRAREAAKGAMASLLGPLQTLQREVGNLANVESVLEDLLQKGREQ